MEVNQSVPQFIASEAVLTLGEDFLDPSGSIIISSISKKEKLGTNLGIYNSFHTVGYAIGLPMGGVVISATLNPYLIWGIVTLPGFAAVIIYLSVAMGKISSSIGKKWT